MLGAGFRRASSKPIQIVRSTSVPGGLEVFDAAVAAHEEDVAAAVEAAAVMEGRAAATPSLVAHSLPTPSAPLMGSSLPPNRFMEDMPLLHLGPQAALEMPADCGSLSASLSTHGIMYVSSCPPTLWGFRKASEHHAARSSRGPSAAAAAAGDVGAANMGSLAEEDEREEQLGEGHFILLEEGPEGGGSHGGSFGSGRGSSITVLSLLEAFAGAQSPAEAAGGGGQLAAVAAAASPPRDARTASNGSADEADWGGAAAEGGGDGGESAQVFLIDELEVEGEGDDTETAKEEKCVGSSGNNEAPILA